MSAKISVVGNVPTVGNNEKEIEVAPRKPAAVISSNDVQGRIDKLESCLATAQRLAASLNRASERALAREARYLVTRIDEMIAELEPEEEE
jgi:hypothetical protein